MRLEELQHFGEAASGEVVVTVDARALFEVDGRGEAVCGEHLVRYLERLLEADWPAQAVRADLQEHLVGNVVVRGTAQLDEDLRKGTRLSVNVDRLESHGYASGRDLALHAAAGPLDERRDQFAGILQAHGGVLAQADAAASLRSENAGIFGTAISGMLILWRTLLLAVMWLTFEAVISWAAFCDYSQNQRAAYEAATEYGCIFRGPVSSLARLFAQWWVHTFDKADAYVALFTGFLFISTVGLWSSTRRLWKVTQASIKATERTTLAVEGAYVFAGIGGSGLVIDMQTGLPWTNPKTGRQEIRLSASAVNYGRSAGLVSAIEWDICRESRLPPLAQP